MRRDTIGPSPESASFSVAAFLLASLLSPGCTKPQQPEAREMLSMPGRWSGATEHHGPFSAQVSECTRGDDWRPTSLVMLRWDAGLHIDGQVRTFCAGASPRVHVRGDAGTVDVEFAIKRGDEVSRCACSFPFEVGLPELGPQQLSVRLWLDQSRVDELRIDSAGRLSDACDATPTYDCYFPGDQSSVRLLHGPLRLEWVSGFDALTAAKVPGLDEAMARSIWAPPGCEKIDLKLQRFGDQFELDVMTCQHGSGLGVQGRTPAQVLQRVVEEDARRNGPGGLAAELTGRFGRRVIVFSTQEVKFSLEEVGRLLFVVVYQHVVEIAVQERTYRFPAEGGIDALSLEVLEELLETIRTIDAATKSLVLRDPRVSFSIAPDRKTATFTADLTGAPVAFITFHQRQVQLPDEGRRVDFRLSLDDGDLQQVPPRPAPRRERPSNP